MPSLCYHISRRVVLALLIMLISSVVPAFVPHSAAASTDHLDVWHDPATHHSITGAFKAFYLDHHGPVLFGSPLTEAFRDGDMSVQYFERARFELRGSSVQLTHLGRMFAHAHADDAPFQWLTASPTPDRQFIPASGHTVGGAIGWFWQSTGGVTVFGYPISEEYEEDGVLVQYFERTRLTYHPAQAGSPEEVQIAPFGRQLLAQRGASASALAPVPPVHVLARATITIAPSAQHNVRRAAQAIDGTLVQSDATMSFLAAVGPITTAAGYQPGQAIVNGALTASVGGGVCYVSTALFRAVWDAGLPVLTRSGHTMLLRAFQDRPGMDAAIDTSGLDLRWRNDTPYPAQVSAALRGATLVVELIGQGDGRTVQQPAPIITANGLDVVNTRVIHPATGAALQPERVRSHYAVPPAVPVATAAAQS